jgi:IrrE N-terminal-like domain
VKPFTPVTGFFFLGSINHPQSRQSPTDLKLIKPPNNHPSKSIRSCSYRSPITITLNPNQSLLQQAKTLAHELGHALLHCGENYTGHDVKSAMELEAESVAFIVLQHFGVDSGDYSFGYISHWVATGTDLEPVIAQLKESGVKIQKATNEIINAIDSFTPKAIASSDTLVATPKTQENDDDVFQLDIAEILAARREMVAA